MGGARSLWGTLAGGIVLGVAQSLGALVSPQGFFIAGHVAFFAVLFARLFLADWRAGRRALLREAQVSKGPAAIVERWTRRSQMAILGVALTACVLAFGPAVFSANAVDKLTTLFIYVILAVSWNALVGFCGLCQSGSKRFSG